MLISGLTRHSPSDFVAITLQYEYRYGLNYSGAVLKRETAVPQTVGG